MPDKPQSLTWNPFPGSEPINVMHDFSFFLYNMKPKLYGACGNQKLDIYSYIRTHTEVTMIYKIINNLVNISCNQCPLYVSLATINGAISSPTHESTATYIPFPHQPSDYQTFLASYKLILNLKQNLWLYISCLYYINLHAHATHTFDYSLVMLCHILFLRFCTVINNNNNTLIIIHLRSMIITYS